MKTNTRFQKGAALLVCLLITLFSPNFSLFAQHSHQHNKQDQTIATERNCHAMDVLRENLLRDPAAQQRMFEIEEHTQAFIRSGAVSDRAVTTIPVVVHVIYRTSTENISDAQIQSQINVLNQDFRRTNADKTTQWSQAADSEIEFCLASRDPNGNATTGITRTLTTVTSFTTNDAMKYSAQGGKDAWPTGSYMNIWVCNIGGGILGYAQFPGSGAAATDGVVIGYNYFGTTGTAAAPFNKGRTATHEVGHWLNLRHIWGDGGCGVDDFVSDTPESDAANYGCTPTHVSCSTADMVENYMDYSDDACMNLFTTGQKTRMQAVLAVGGVRRSLVTSLGCSAPGTGPAQYCASNATNVSYEWISRVTLNTINNSTTGSVGGYGNFTAQSTSLTKGTAYTIQLTPGFSGSAYSEYFKVYIDYNGDKDFDDAGENVYTSAGTSAMVSGSFTIPTTAITGATRMRVVMKDGSITSPCGAYTYGEVEDYTINLVAAAATCSDIYESNNSISAAKTIAVNTNLTALLNVSTDVDYFKFSNTTANKNIRVTLTNLPADYDLKLYNSAGTLINTSQNGGTTSESIVLNNATVGTYYVHVYGYSGAFSASACYTINASISSASFREEGEVNLVPKVEQLETEELRDFTIRLYPNPTTDFLNIQVATQTANVRSQIIDLTGRVLWVGDLDNGDNIIHVNHLAAGVYYLTVLQGDGKMITEKFVKTY